MLILRFFCEYSPGIIAASGASNAVKTAINRIGNGLSNANERCFFTQK